MADSRESTLADNRDSQVRSKLSAIHYRLFASCNIFPHPPLYRVDARSFTGRRATRGLSAIGGENLGEGAADIQQVSAASPFVSVTVWHFPPSPPGAMISQPARPLPTC